MLAVQGVVATLAIAAAVGAAVAALTARMRHIAQTDRLAERRLRQALKELENSRHLEADRRRRLKESYSRAVEQLASEKIEGRLAGIKTLERISKATPDDYWTVIETLTAFVRERARWRDSGTVVSETARLYLDGVREERQKPPSDIAAALKVIARRDPANYKRETTMRCGLNLWDTDLRGGYLLGAHLEGANLSRAHLEGAILNDAHLQGAILARAHLENASLTRSHLERADLIEAHLEGAILDDAHLEGVNLWCAHLEGACIRGATGLTTERLAMAFCNADTKLPDGVTRPARWLAGSS